MGGDKVKPSDMDLEHFASEVAVIRDEVRIADRGFVGLSRQGRRRWPPRQ